MNTVTFELHYESTVEYELLNKFYKPAIDNYGLFMTNTEIKDYIEKNSEQKLYHKRLGAELKRAGFVRTYSQEKKLYGYMVQRNDIIGQAVAGNFTDLPDWAK